MKILMLVPVPPDRGAPGAIPALLHAALVGLADEHELTLVVPAGPDPPELEAVDRLRDEGWNVHAVLRHLDPRRWSRRARMAGAWARGRWPWRTVWFHEPAVQAVLDRLLRDQTFDVIAVEDNSMANYRLPNDVPSVLTEHEVRRRRPFDWHLGPPRQWPAALFREMDWRRWPRYENTVWHRFDGVVVFTQRDADSIAATAPDLRGRVHVAPFGIELPSLADEVVCEPNTIAFLGNYTHPPNVDAAVHLAREVLPLVRAAVPEVRLRLAGIHAPVEVEALASESIDVVGVVDDADAFLRRHAVFAAAIHTGGGMRMKVLHAMALQCAVVTTSRGSEGLRFADEPAVVVADEAATMAAAMVELLQSDDRRLDLGRRARHYVEMHHGPAAVADRLTRVYGAVIDAHRNAGSR